MFLYYRKKSYCNGCEESNNVLFCRTKCSDKTCNGFMVTDFDEMSIYQELKFLNALIKKERDNDNDSIVINFNNAVKSVENYVRRLNEEIIFTKVNISELFGFLNQK